jgi:periplasmic divalent cation tolerance protein
VAQGEYPSTILVLTTLPDAARGRAFVRELVDRRLVACGTVIDRVTSIYRWEGTVEEAGEAQVILKTDRERWTQLEQVATDLHPYDVPELLALPIERGFDAYLQWVRAETTTNGAGG